MYAIKFIAYFYSTWVKLMATRIWAVENDSNLLFYFEFISGQFVMECSSSSAAKLFAIPNGTFTRDQMKYATFNSHFWLMNIFSPSLSQHVIKSLYSHLLSAPWLHSESWLYLLFIQFIYSNFSTLCPHCRT